MANDLRDTARSVLSRAVRCQFGCQKTGRASKLFSVFGGVASFHMAHLLFAGLL